MKKYICICCVTSGLGLLFAVMLSPSPGKKSYILRESVEAVSPETLGIDNEKSSGIRFTPSQPAEIGETVSTAGVVLKVKDSSSMFLDQLPENLRQGEKYTAITNFLARKKSGIDAGASVKRPDEIKILARPNMSDELQSNLWHRTLAKKADANVAFATHVVGQNALREELKARLGEEDYSGFRIIERRMEVAEQLAMAQGRRDDGSEFEIPLSNRLEAAKQLLEIAATRSSFDSHKTELVKELGVKYYVDNQAFLRHLATRSQFLR